jgi:hypothetical protein
MPVAPILFLDIDGVLNSVEWMKHGTMWGSNLGALDPVACARLDRVLVATGADIVLSSAWRHSTSCEKMQTFLRVRGCPSARVIDRTPWGSEMPPDSGDERGHQIQHWLDTHPTPRFAIVDDSTDMVHLLPKLIRTPWETGLGDEHVELLIAMLLEGT